MRILTVVTGFLLSIPTLANGITISLDPLTVRYETEGEVKQYQPCLPAEDDDSWRSALGRVVELLGPGATVIEGAIDAKVLYPELGLAFMPWELARHDYRTFRYMPMVYLEADLQGALQIEPYDGRLPEWVVPAMSRSDFLKAARARGAEAYGIDADTFPAKFNEGRETVVGYFDRDFALEMVLIVCEL